MVIVIVASVAYSTWFAVDHLRDFSIEQAESDLLIRARLVKRQIHAPFTNKSYKKLKTICREINDDTVTRVTLILPSGEVVADSMKDHANMDNHAYRPEIIEARKSGVGTSIRQSQTVGKEMLYLAIPLFPSLQPDSDKISPSGILRLSIPITTVNIILSKVLVQIVLSAVFKNAEFGD